MSIVLDSNRSFVNIAIYYIEEKKKNGHSVYTFITSAEEMDRWQSQGYVLRSVIAVPDTSAIAPKNAPKSLTTPKTEVPTKIIETLNTTWKRLTWKEQNEIFTQAVRIKGETTEIDVLKLRDLKLKTCLKQWDAKDDLGNPIPVNTETIDNLCPDVANELIRSFEFVTESRDDRS